MNDVSISILMGVFQYAAYQVTAKHRQRFNYQYQNGKAASYIIYFVHHGLAFEGFFTQQYHSQYGRRDGNGQRVGMALQKA